MHGRTGSGRRVTRLAALAVVLLAAAAPVGEAHPARPDLTVRTLGEPPTFGVPGQSFTVTDVVANDGRRTAGPSWVRYRLVREGARITVGGRLVGRLRRGATAERSKQLRIPASIADGSYRLEACADAFRWVRESDESNNCRVSAGVLVIDTAGPPAPALEEAPRDPAGATTARFAFSAPEPGVSFACSLDGAPFGACESPVEYTELSEGRHRFEVRARDAAGNESAVVAHEWTIDTTPPPVPVIGAGPGEVTTAHSATFAFSDDETGVTFSCRLDDGEWSTCESPRDYARIEDGEHAFELRALDAAANVSAPARHRWTVVPDEMTLGDGAWSWFADPRAVHDPLRGRTYVGWVARDGDIKVAAYDHGTLMRATVDLHPHLQGDDHANPAIQLLPDGRLRVFYSGHGGNRMYYRTSLAPGDVGAWSEERTIPGNTPGSWGYTYPNPVRLAAEARTYLFWRGGNFNPTFATQDDGADGWSAARNLIFVASERPYVKYDSDGVDTIHLAFTNAHPREASDVNIYYAAVRGGELRHADGSLAGTLAAPITPSDADLVYDGAANAWVHDVAHDAQGNPVIVFARFPAPDDHRYMYARWTGSEWSVHEITPAGGSIHDVAGEEQYSAGITLDHEDPSIVELSRPVAGTFEVETWRTPDGGASWEQRAVTAGSSAKNVRPVTPRGMKPFSTDLAVVWMHGVYTSYVDYKTSITTILATGGNEPPIADFEPSARSGAAPQEVAFDASASRDPDGTIAELRWDFGDGETGTGTEVRHTYTAPGRFFPTLTVVDDAGARSVAIDEVVVGPAEAPVVTTGPATAIDEDSATLNGTVDARKQPTTYRFEYGTTDAYGASTPEEALAGDLGAHAVSAPLTGLAAGPSYHYRVVARNATGERAGGDRVFTARAPGPSAYRADVMGTGGLVAYWRLGELDGSTAADETGAFAGTYRGGYRLGEAGALPGDPDYAAGFDGSSGEMTATGSALASGRGSIEGWFDWRSGVAVMRDDTSVAGVGWIVAFDSSGRLFYRLGGTNFNTGRTSASVRGAWHHVVVTSDGVQVAFYLDGVQIHRANAAITRAPAMPWHVMRNGNQPTEYSAGRADEVAVYDRALTADEALRHYRLGSAPAP